jgi:hypothetical protein
VAAARGRDDADPESVDDDADRKQTDNDAARDPTAAAA